MGIENFVCPVCNHQFDAHVKFSLDYDESKDIINMFYHIVCPHCGAHLDCNDIYRRDSDTNISFNIE